MAIQQGATDAFATGLMNGVYNFTTDSFKIALYTGSASLGPDTAVYTAGLTSEVVATGYTAGGIALPVSVTPTSANNTTFISFSNVTWNAALTASGALIYKSGGTNPTVCVLDFGSEKTSTATFTIQFPTANSSDAIIRIT
jgi:hypothetical protein